MNQMTVNILSEADFDVVVCGGGTAGFCAALAAARMGANTAVIERFGAFGGTMTVGGVSAPALFHAHGRQIIAGIGWELMETLAKNGFASLPPAPFTLRHPQNAVELNAFQAEVEIDRMMKRAGVRVFFHQSVVYAEAEGKHVNSILINTTRGLKRIRAKIYIDCTGDGNVCAMAGAEYELSDELQPASLNSIFVNCEKAADDPQKYAEDFRGRVEAGSLDEHDIWGLNGGALVTGHGRGRGEPFAKNYTINIGNNLNHVYPFNGADNESRTEGEMAGRASIARVIKWLNDTVPGYENAYVASCAPVTSARESRRVVGNAYVTGEDYVNGVCPPDSVCYSFYPIDVHRGTETSPLDNVFLTEGRVPGIPYGALVAKGFDNLMMAGRIASGDRRAQSAYRVQASCMAMGEAAGTAAALACRHNCGADQIDTQELRNTLRANGAIVPD